METPPNNPPPPEDLCYWISSLSTASLRGLGWKLAPYEITPPQAGILAMCAGGYANTVTALARIVPIETAAVSRQVHKLTERGLLRRVPLPSDRRSVRLEITEEGTALLPRLMERAHANDAVLLAGIGEDERDAFIATVKKMLANVAAEERTRGEVMS